MENFFNNIFNNIKLEQFINPIIYIIIAIVIYILLDKLVSLFFERSRNKVATSKFITESHLNRIATLKAMVMSIIKYVAVFAVGLAILANFGVDISSLLAGLGIATAVLGFAFQDLAKDIIAGFSIITEAQYEVGDLIEVNGFRGRVVSVGLKTTRIKNYRGKVKIISNRNMDELINYTKFDTLAEVDVTASYEDDPDKVEKALEEVKKT